jgi:hypothetical protein
VQGHICKKQGFAVSQQPPATISDRVILRTSCTKTKTARHNNMSDSDDDVAIDGTSPATRRRPFVLLTGTPGVGKTATASLLAVRTVNHYVHSQNNQTNKCKSLPIPMEKKFV